MKFGPVNGKPLHVCYRSLHRSVNTLEPLEDETFLSLVRRKFAVQAGKPECSSCNLSSLLRHVQQILHSRRQLYLYICDELILLKNLFFLVCSRISPLKNFVLSLHTTKKLILNERKVYGIKSFALLLNLEVIGWVSTWISIYFLGSPV